MVTLNEITALIKDKTGVDEDEVQEQTDILTDLGVVGDDFHELIDEYARKYQVDMTVYLWYFHADEEGQNIGGIFFRPPYERVQRIPVTPIMLKEFANKGKWEIDYPNHQLPKKRYDLLFNQILSLIVFSSIILGIIWRLIN